jgi:hypothetical protein
MMRTTDEFRKRFLTDRDDSGRFLVVSIRTGKTYFVEPLGPDRAADWGRYNPLTGNIENKKGFDKHRGAIDENDSLITKENGFSEITYAGLGCSPFSVIDQLDAKYADARTR